MAASLAIATLLVAVVGFGKNAAASATRTAGTLSSPVIERPASPSWAADAPDPDIAQFGSAYYAYTTGTTWGNNLGVLESTSPVSGWHTTTGLDSGSTLLPDPPAWQIKGSETSPTVARIGLAYVMFYDARLRAEPGLYCLSRATSPDPAGPFTDRSHGHFGPCSASYDGSIDPDIVTLADGKHWLTWKENESGPSHSAQIRSKELSPNGRSLVGATHVLLTQQSATYHWETTAEDPALTYAAGEWWLLFSAGSWTNSTYSEAFVRCSGPAGPCEGKPKQILTSYGRVHGPGGGATFESAAGVWYLAFAAWTGTCHGLAESCGRELYVAPVEFSRLEVSTRSLAVGVIGKPYVATLRSSGGLGPHTWSSPHLPPGLRLDALTGELAGTPGAAGVWPVMLRISTAPPRRERATRTITITVRS